MSLNNEENFLKENTNCHYFHLHHDSFCGQNNPLFLIREWKKYKWDEFLSFPFSFNFLLFYFSLKKSAHYDSVVDRKKSWCLILIKISAQKKIILGYRLMYHREAHNLVISQSDTTLFLYNYTHIYTKWGRMIMRRWNNPVSVMFGLFCPLRKVFWDFCEFNLGYGMEKWFGIVEKSSKRWLGIGMFGNFWF